MSAAPTVEELQAQVESLRRIARGALMLADSVLSPEAPEHPHSIALQAEAVRKLAREALQ